jgi:RNA polymerase sigma factor (sigma-70 family)
VDRSTDIGGQRVRFPSTRASLFDAVAEGPGTDALDRIIAVYWKPVYWFIRLKFGKDNEDAKDLTQGFFTSALQRDFFERFDPGKASFRTYLRMAVERFAATEHEAATRQKRGGAVQFEPLDEHEVAGESPEAAFEREWRRQLFALALDDVRARCEREGKLAQWRVFAAYDLADGDHPSYAALAAEHGVPETSVTNYLAWARRALRAAVTERLRGVTAGEGDLREEARRLWT